MGKSHPYPLKTILYWSHSYSESGWSLEKESGSVSHQRILRPCDVLFVKGYTSYLGDNFSNTYFEAMSVLLGLSLGIGMGFSSFLI